MDQFQHRRAARIVAYVDLVLCGLAVIVIVVILGPVTTAVLVDDFNKHPNDGDIAISAMLVIILAVGTTLGCIQMWTVVMLLKATEQGAEASQALHRVKIWRMVASVFLAISLLISFCKAEFLELLFQLIIRGVMLYYVNLFIKELTGFVQNSGAQVP